MLAILLAAVLGSSGIHGTWSLLTDGDRVQLTVNRDHSNWSQGMPRADFPLSDAQINAAAETPVHFVLARDAGTITFDGTFQNGEGVGRFSFAPSSTYAATLSSMGVGSDDPLDDERLFAMAMHDVSVAFIREMQSLGLHEDLQTYVRFRIHGITPQFVRDMRSLGFQGASAEDLVRFRIHGVTPEFVRDMRSLGFESATAEDLVRFRIHGVTPKYVRAIRGLGVTGLSSESFVRLRIHGASTDYVRDLADLGYRNLAAEDLVRMRIHGVTPDFIRELGNAGYHGIPVDKLVQMRIHGIDASMLARSNQ
jgi:hypothetical protein